MFVRLCCAALVLFSVAGCTKKKSAPRLLSDSELAALVREGKARVAASAAMTCSRPVLRGSARPGSRAASLAEMDRAKPAATKCRDVLGQVRQVVSATLFECPKDKPSGPDPDPFACRARAPTDPAWTTDQIVAITNACAPLIEKMSAAIGFSDACAPAAPGRAKVELASEVNVGVAALVIAGQRARAGRWVDAFELVLDALRWQQDLGRGGGPLQSVHTTSAMMADLVGYGHDLLDQGPYTATQHAELGRQLDLLIAAAVRPGFAFGNLDLMAAERQGWIDVLEGTGPGAVDPNPELTRAFANRGDAAAMRWLAIKRVANELSAACPLSGSLMACNEAMAKLDSKWRAERSALESTLGGRIAIGDLLGQDEPVAAIRRDVITALAAGGVDSYRRIAKRLATRLGDLVGLRIHVELRRQAAQSKKCPGLEELVAATGSMRSPAQLGGEITIESAGDGAFWIRAPAWLTPKSAPDVSRPAPKLARIACPSP